MEEQKKDKRGRKKLPTGERKIVLSILVKGKHKKQAQKMIKEVEQIINAL
jgi:hypothetical protein